MTATTTTIEEIRAALDACTTGDARTRWAAQQYLRDHAEVYVERLLDAIDRLTYTEQESA